jgi:uncharacterized membrane protein (UPF0127 family)
VLYPPEHRNFVSERRAFWRFHKQAIPFNSNASKREKGTLAVVTKTKLIVNLTSGDAVCVGELADRPLRRMRGLIGRRGLPAGEGLLLSPAPAIHTAFMRFPIDALFLDRNLQVLDIVERLVPWRVASKRRARAVLELSAGECARRGVEVGDRLELRDRSVTALLQSAPNGADADAPAVDANTSGPGTTRAPQSQGGELARLQPLRVLVISSDRHFRTMTSLLLARRNCSVTTTANTGRVTQLIARESTDVVVIDASQLAPAVVKSTVATVKALSRPVGALVVAEEVRPAASDVSALAKWGPFEDLVAAIERTDERRGTWRVTHDRA